MRNRSWIVYDPLGPPVTISQPMLLFLVTTSILPMNTLSISIPRISPCLSPTLLCGISSTTPLRRQLSSLSFSSQYPQKGVGRKTELIGRRTAAATTVVMCSLSSSAAAYGDSEAFVKNAVDSSEIVIFSKSYCPYCARAKSVFKDMNKTPVVFELDEREDGQDIQSALGKIVGRQTVPQVFVKGQHIGGSDDTVDAYANGKLAQLLAV